jgi:hypothetical protein
MLRKKCFNASSHNSQTQVFDQRHLYVSAVKLFNTILSGLQPRQVLQIKNEQFDVTVMPRGFYLLMLPCKL